MEADLKDREDQQIPAPRNKNQQAVNLKKGEPVPALMNLELVFKEPTLPCNLLKCAYLL